INPAFDKTHVHTGAIVGVVNIRNIQLDAPQFQLPGTSAIYQPVLFDGDLQLSDDIQVISGGATDAFGRRLIPSRGIRGYILIDNEKYTSGTVKLPKPSSAAQVQLLLKMKGPAVAPVSCTLGFGGQADKPGLKMRVSQVDVSCDASGTPNLVCAARG